MKDNTMLVSIIIPFYDKWELTHKRLMEIHTHAPDNCEIILVDDCSVGNYDHHIGWWQNYGAKHPVYYVKNEKNLGFGGAMNRGAKKAKGDILVFLSNDVVIYNDFITPIVVADQYHEHKCLMGHRLIDWDAGWNNLHGNIAPYLEGYFLACHKDVWKELGGFDDIFAPYAVEDIDLSMMAVYKGYKLIELPEIKLNHLVGQTAEYTDERNEITKRNKERLIEKWQGKI